MADQRQQPFRFWFPYWSSNPAPTPSRYPATAPARRLPRTTPSLQPSAPSQSPSQAQPKSTSSATPLQPPSTAQGRAARPPSLSPSASPPPSQRSRQSQPSDQRRPQQPSPSRAAAQLQSPSRTARPGSKKGDLPSQPSQRESGEQAAAPLLSPGASELQPATPVEDQLPSLSVPPTSQPESQPDQPKALPQIIPQPPVETILPKLPKSETQLQTTSTAQNVIPTQPASQPTEPAKQTSQDLEPTPVPADFLMKDVSAKPIPTTPFQPQQFESQPEEEKGEKPRTDIESKQEPKPFQLPGLEEKPEASLDEKSKTIAEAKQEMHPIEIPKPIKKPEETRGEPKTKAEAKQDTQPSENSKPEKTSQTREERKTIAEEKIEMRPTETPKTENFSAETKEPKTRAEVKQEIPREATKSETTSDEIKEHKPKTKPEAQEKPQATEPKLTILVSDSGPTRSQRKTSEHTSYVRNSEPEDMTTRNGSNRKENRIAISTIPQGSLSMGEQSNFQKDVKEGISKLVQKLSIGQQAGTDQGVSIITLAGENKGATMLVGHRATDREGSMHSYRDYKIENNTAKATSNNNVRNEESSTHIHNGTPEITTSINSNVQSINNSLLHECSCCEEDPGVHLIISSQPTENVYFTGRMEPHKTQKTSSSILPAQKLTYDPNIRRRCLRALFVESSESDLENPKKPRRHGCRFSCDDKKKGKADDDGISTTNRNGRQTAGNTSKA